MAYDKNGLQLSPVAETRNTYRRTAVDMTQRKFSAYAASRPTRLNEWAMHTIGLYKDPRDAAYVAQEFEKLYDKVAVRQMIIDDTFTEVAKEFRENIDIPEWKFEAEGLTIEEMLGETGYKRNYVDNARDALIEALHVAGIKTPALKEAKLMMAAVEKLVSKNGMTYRRAAKKVVEK